MEVIETVLVIVRNARGVEREEEVMVVAAWGVMWREERKGREEEEMEVSDRVTSELSGASD